MTTKLTKSFRAFIALANSVVYTTDFRPTWREVGYALWIGLLIQLLMAIGAIGLLMEIAWLLSFVMPASPLPSLPGVGQ